MRQVRELFRRSLDRLRAPPKGPRISIVINTLNRADSLARTLTGLARLDAEDFEVIVVAGPSTDHTDAVLATHGSSIRVGRCPEAILGASRNVGLAMAAGDVVAFTDDDSVPRPHWIGELRRGYADPRIGGVGGPVYDAVHQCMQWRAGTVARDGTTNTDAAPPYEQSQGPAADPCLYLAGCNMSYRRGLLIAVGGFNEHLRSIYDDADVAMRMHQAGHRLAYRPECLVDHFYAESHVRDAGRVIRDPYNPARDFGVFIASRPEVGSNEAGQSPADRQRDVWHQYATQQVTAGQFRQAERDAFLSRAEAGLNDGLRGGAAPRMPREFPPADREAFLPFRAARGGEA